MPSIEKKVSIHPRPSYAWIVFMLSVIFSAYTHLLQDTPNLYDLTEKTTVHIKNLVFAVSGYFIAFTVFQIPVGILIDRFGSRLVPTIGLCLSSIGAISLTYVTTNSMIFISKFIIGCGGSFAFLNALKIISSWFQPKRFAFLVGLFIALDIIVTLILTYLYEIFKKPLSWHEATLFFALGGLIFACVFFFVVQDTPGSRFTTQSINNNNKFWTQIKHLFKNPQTWLIGITIGLITGPLFSFASIWSLSFVQQAYKVPYQMATIFKFCFVLGYGLGAIFFGKISTLLKKRKVFIPYGLSFSLFFLIIILYPPYLTPNITIACFFFLGFAASTIILGYVMIHEQHVPQVTATSIAIVNTFYAFVATISQSFTATYIDMVTEGQFLHFASLKTYQIALIGLPIYIGIAIVFSFFIKDTYPKKKYK